MQASAGASPWWGSCHAHASLLGASPWLPTQAFVASPCKPLLLHGCLCFAFLQWLPCPRKPVFGGFPMMAHARYGLSHAKPACSYTMHVSAKLQERFLLPSSRATACSAAFPTGGPPFSNLRSKMSVGLPSSPPCPLPSKKASARQASSH